MMNWPKIGVPGQFNMMPVCQKCKLTSLQTNISYYCQDITEGGPYLCDNCRGDPECRKRTMATLAAFTAKYRQGIE